MCAVCGCGKKKGQAGYGKGPKKKAAKKTASKGMSAKQKKLDVDKDGKLEGSDFAALRGKKKK
jgi:hypothetical protein